MIRRFALPVLATTVLLLHVARYAETWTDDAFITFRYARHVAEGVGMAFNPGDRVEGLTNLGYALLLAPFSGGDLLRVAQLVGITTTVATVVLLARWCAAQGLGRSATVAVLAVAVVAPPMAWWAVQGLETPILLFLTTVAWIRYPRERLGGAPVAALALAVAPWIRPDAALTVAVIGAWHLGNRRRLSARVLAPILVSAVLLIALKLAWFGTILPQTFHVKVGNFPPERGLLYLFHFLTFPTPILPVLLLAGAALGVARARRGDDRALPGILFVAHLAAAVLEDGDIFADWRLLVPVWPAAAGGLGFLVQAAVDRWKGRTLVVSVMTLGALLAALIPAWRSGGTDQLDTPTPTATVATSAPPWAPWAGWQQGGQPRDRAPFAVTWALANAGDTDTVAYSELGLIGWLFDGPVLDMLGLTDPIMAASGDVGWARGFTHVESRAGVTFVSVRGSLWSRWRDRLTQAPWVPEGACGDTWVFRNTAIPLHPPDTETLSRRYAEILRRAPRMRGVLTGLAAELVAAGRTDEARRWLDAVERAGALDAGTLAGARCAAGLREGCDVQPTCEYEVRRRSAAALGVPGAWPGASGPASAVMALPEPPVDADCQALRARAGGDWEDLARDVPHVDAWRRVGAKSREAARLIRAGDPGASTAAEAALAAVREAGEPAMTARAERAAAETAEALRCE